MLLADPEAAKTAMSNVTSPSAIAELHTNRVRMGHADEDGRSEICAAL